MFFKKEKNNTMDNKTHEISEADKKFVLKAIDKLKDPYNMRKKTYQKLLAKCGNDNVVLNRLIIESTGNRVDGLVL